MLSAHYVQLGLPALTSADEALCCQCGEAIFGAAGRGSNDWRWPLTDRGGPRPFQNFLKNKFGKAKLTKKRDGATL
jgi:hypothetical protein